VPGLRAASAAPTWSATTPANVPRTDAGVAQNETTAEHHTEPNPIGEPPHRDLLQPGAPYQSPCPMKTGGSAVPQRPERRKREAHDALAVRDLGRGRDEEPDPAMPSAGEPGALRPQLLEVDWRPAASARCCSTTAQARAPRRSRCRALPMPAGLSLPGA